MWGHAVRGSNNVFVRKGFSCTPGPVHASPTIATTMMEEAQRVDVR